MDSLDLEPESETTLGNFNDLVLENGCKLETTMEDITLFNEPEQLTEPVELTKPLLVDVPEFISSLETNMNITVEKVEETPAETFIPLTPKIKSTFNHLVVNDLNKPAVSQSFLNNKLPKHSTKKMMMKLN